MTGPMKVEITTAIATKVRDLVDAGLVAGVGTPVPGQMCVEAAVCFALGLPHGDDPGCVSPALRQLKIHLNDAQWSAPLARAAGLRRLALAQLGSAGILDDTAFGRRVVDLTIRRMVPIALRASIRRNASHGEALAAAAVRCEVEGTRDACRHAREIAYAAYAAALAAAYAAYAADAYADAAATAAAYAAYAAVAAAADADADAATAAAYAADAAYDDRARDRVLSQYAEWIVEILVKMQAPGCQWLDLVPIKELA